MNNHQQFLSFCDKKRLTSKKKEDLRKSRNAIREKIRVSFANKDRKKPNFAGQGSYVIKTTIKPLDGEYDIDDGVYLNNIDTSKDISEWEKTETVHSWIYDAVKEHTNETQSKARCVRVIYANDYHVDLPIYVIKNDVCYIAEKGDKQWHKSDPKAINDWFKDRDNEERKKLRRLSIYLKAWKDFREFNNQSLKLIGGLQLTVLAEEYFCSSNDDEEMFFKTVEKINNNLSLHPPLTNPIDKYADLFSVYSDGKIDTFKDEFDSLYNKSKAAYDEKNNLESAKLWQKVFGDEFLLPEENKTQSTNNLNTKSFDGFRVRKNSLDYSSTEQYIEDYFNINQLCDLKIDCEVEQDGFRKTLLKYIPLLKSDKKLRFFIQSTSAREPYSIKWKVKNQGEESRLKRQLRGEISDDNGHKEKIEHTRYKGSHYVECFIIKNGQCVARDKIEVPIEISK